MATPFAILTLYLEPPHAFATLFGYYFFGEYQQNVYLHNIHIIGRVELENSFENSIKIFLNCLK